MSRRSALLASFGAATTVISRGRNIGGVDFIARAADVVVGTTPPSLGTTAGIADRSPSPRQSSPSSTLEETISGIFAGSSLTVTKTLVKYPLDTATVRLQVPSSSSRYDNNPMELFKDSYNGITAPLLTNIPAGAVFFGVKDSLKPFLNDQFGFLPKWARTSLAVLVAQFPYWVVRNPSEVVKTKQQAGVEGFDEGVAAVDAYKRVFEDARRNLGTNSSTAGTAAMAQALRDGFYVGYWENILYAYPADVIKFVCYDLLLGGRTSKESLTPLEGAAAGAISTGIAQLLTTPLDVVRNRVMAASRTGAKNVDDGDDGRSETTTAPMPSSYADALIRLAREEGLPGLFAGASPRVGKALLSGAIQFATYEETKRDVTNLLFRRE